MEEIWAIIGEFPNYEVSDRGDVRRIGSIKNHSHGRQSCGYIQVILCSGGKVSHRYIHRLVAIAFVPNPHGKLQVNHINGVKTDNQIENLEWATRSENMLHAYNSGLQKPKRGSSADNAKLTDHQEREIRSLYSFRGEHNAVSMAERFGVSKAAIQNIINYASYIDAA